MKIRSCSIFTMAGLAMAVPAAADVFYSNFQNIEIPTTFDGVYLNVETGAWNTPTNLGAGVSGWDVNAFYGGRAFANSPDFQPVRSGVTSSSAILNLAEGATVGSGSVFSTFVQGAGGGNPGGPGYGGSQMLTGMGGNFTAGTEGYIGFRLNGTDYGSMRVVLTNNTSGAYIRDWAYDTSGAPVVVGAIKQVGQDIILSSGFTLAASSALIDSGGATNLVKNGSGTNILKSTNTYTGTTTVNAGTLEIASTGSTHASSAVTVSNSGSALVVNGTVGGTLVANASTTISGSGTVNGGATVSGNLNPGNGGAGLLNFGSSLAMADTTLTTMEIAGTNLGIDHDAIDVGGLLTYDGALTLALGATFGNGSHTFDLFDFTSHSGSFGSIALSGNYNATLTNNSGIWSATTNINGNETWTFTQSTGNLTLTVVPEPRAALLGGLGLLLLLRRRR